MLDKLRDVRLQVRRNVKAEVLLWVAPGLLMIGNIASTSGNMGTLGGLIAFAGIFALVGGLVMLGTDASRDEME